MCKGDNCDWFRMIECSGHSHVISTVNGNTGSDQYTSLLGYRFVSNIPSAYPSLSRIQSAGSVIEGAQPTLSSDSASQRHAICSQLQSVTSPGKHTSSKDPSITNLIVVTSFVCPIRCTRASACSSTVGFHWGSIMYTLDAAVISRLCSVSDMLEQR